jgi:hypothetical protein
MNYKEVPQNIVDLWESHGESKVSCATAQTISSLYMGVTDRAIAYFGPTRTAEIQHIIGHFILCAYEAGYKAKEKELELSELEKIL